MEIRHYQQQALDNIFKHDRCLVKMFCGTGKSLILTETLLQLKSNISVIVFPSLSLIQQYSSEYIHRFNAYNVINISSEKLEFHTTTHSAKIDAFLSLPDPKLVLVTYQSYEVLIRSLKGRTIAACFDEAHHVVSPEYQKLIFDPSHYERQVFFTATPRNENGIVMYDRNHPELNMCGPLAFDYTFLDGLNDGYLNGFEICVDMFSQNSNASMYDVIARAVLRHGKNRILTFHSGVNGEKNTSVWKFVDPDEFQTAFDRVVEKEFPNKRGLYTKITMRGMDGETPSDQRKRWLHEMDKSPLHEIYLIASCETIGEGVDTKHANMVVFVDPKTSNIKIIQNIGRVLRLNRESPYSVVLVPVYVNLENYASANGDPVLQDELIKEQMRSERGDYAPIMNVLAALNQEDPELYEMCLTFPNKAHKLHSLQQQGFDVDEEIEYSPDEVSTLRSAGTPLELHTDETIVRINEKEGAGEEPPLKRIKPNELVRLYYDSDDDVYRPIITDDDDNRPIQPPKKRISLSMHQDDDVQILWRVKEFDAEKFGSIVLECSVSWNVINWYKKHKEVCEYMDDKKKRPSTIDENPETKKLGGWISHQITNYKKGIMKDPEIRKVWEETLQKYDEYLCDTTEQWYKKHKEVCEYMDTNHKRPNKRDKNPETKKLGGWISYQITNYKKGIMKDPKIRKVWEETLQKYDEYLCDTTEQWYKKHKEVCEYMDTNHKRPSKHDQNPETNSLGTWISHQITNYKKGIMKDPEIRKVWEETLQKYDEYLCDATAQWHKTHKQVCEYMDVNKKRPNSYYKNPEIKSIGTWTTTQITHYKKGIMKDPEIRKVWEETLQKYDEYLCDATEQWHKTHKQVCEYMDTNHKRPSQVDEETKSLGIWISNQRANYKKGSYIMKDPEIRKVWEDTLQKYDEYLCDATEQWHINHKELCRYMDTNHKRPSKHDQNPETKSLGNWISTQITNYKKGDMKDPEIRKVWEETLQKYDEYLCDATEHWHINHKEVCQYMDTNHKRPSQHDQNPETKKLASWISNQITHYKKGDMIMKDPKIRKVWEDTLQKYDEYLFDATEQWHINHKEVCEYMDDKKKRPSTTDKIPEIKKLGLWICHQLTNYKNDINSMKDPKIRKVWEETLQKYDEYLCDATEQWYKKHKELCQYMDVNHKKPTYFDKNPETKKLGTWTTNQLTRYKNGIMKDPEIRKVWEETLRKYPFLQSKMKTYADLSEEERRLICEKHLKQHLEKGYHSTNPDDKDIINKVFASDVLPGKVVFLDHVEFKTAYALLERGIKPEHMVIPQRQDNFEVMASHELFGSSVVLGEFNDVLESVLQTCKVAGIYADYCSTLEKDGIPFVDLVCKYKSSCENAVVGVTITLRNPEGVRYAGQDIQMMEKKLCRAFPTSENLFYKYAVVPDDGPYTYGGGAPMATWMIKL
jgi:superfamily II DNA or RNA helicase